MGACCSFLCYVIGFVTTTCGVNIVRFEIGSVTIACGVSMVSFCDRVSML